MHIESDSIGKDQREFGIARLCYVHDSVETLFVRILPPSRLALQGHEHARCMRGITAREASASWLVISRTFK